MGIELGPIEPQLETAVRKYVESISLWRPFSEAGHWGMTGAPLRFYKQSWLCLLTSAGGDVRVYMVVRASKRARIRKLATLCNATGEVDQINRKFRLDLSTTNVLDYLAFYYAFTPKQDVLSRNLKRPPSQFHIPLSMAGVTRAPGGDPDLAPGQQDLGCLVRGAIWRYLDRRNSARVVATRLRGNKVLKRFSGNVLIQFRDGLFSADFRVATRYGVPILSNVELVFKDARLRAPREIMSQDLPRLKTLRNVKEDLIDGARRAKDALLRYSAAGSWRAATFIAGALWAISAAFPLLEAADIPIAKPLLGWLGHVTHIGNWADTLFVVANTGILFWLAGIIYFTHMENLFNAMFKVCPTPLRAWLAGWLDDLAKDRDRSLTARDTLLKRSRYTLVLFVLWAGYLILAFASLQMTLGHATILPDAAKGLPSAPPLATLGSLTVQAILNVPIFFFLLYRLGVELIPHESLHPTIIAVFHIAIAAVVVKGVYRIWALSSEASPRNFIRRLMARNEKAGS